MHAKAIPRGLRGWVCVLFLAASSALAGMPPDPCDKEEASAARPIAAAIIGDRPRFSANSLTHNPPRAQQTGTPVAQQAAGVLPSTAPRSALPSVAASANFFEELSACTAVRF